MRKALRDRAKAIVSPRGDTEYSSSGEPIAFPLSREEALSEASQVESVGAIEAIYETCLKLPLTKGYVRWEEDENGVVFLYDDGRLVALMPRAAFDKMCETVDKGKKKP